MFTLSSECQRIGYATMSADTWRASMHCIAIDKQSSAACHSCSVVSIRLPQRMGMCEVCCYAKMHQLQYHRISRHSMQCYSMQYYIMQCHSIQQYSMRCSIIVHGIMLKLSLDIASNAVGMPLATQLRVYDRAGYLLSRLTRLWSCLGQVYITADAIGICRNDKCQPMPVAGAVCM